MENNRLLVGGSILFCMAVAVPMQADSDYIKPFTHVTLQDVPSVGGKNASLGEMIGQLSAKGIRVPQGFAITSDAYWYYLDYNNLRPQLSAAMAQLTDVNDISQLQQVGRQVRELIEYADMPADLQAQITQAYHSLSALYGQANVDVAVRSSATAEDLPNASFAGQQETFLNVRGADELLLQYKRCIASLFNDRAILYRAEQGYDHFNVALSVGVQKMVRSDCGASGVAFSLDTETGFKDVVMINASFGLGELVVQGAVTPDEFCVHKPTFAQGFASIIKKQRGNKHIKMIYDHAGGHAVATVPVSAEDQIKYALSDAEILDLTRAVITIEEHYSARKGSWCPMDVEWAKDGIDGQIYIVQARPETIHSNKKYDAFFSKFVLKMSKQEQEQKRVVIGNSVGQHIAAGRVRVITDIAHINDIQKGEILVTEMTDPDWVPAMKKAAGIITDRGGRTCHAAIISRELNIPALVGCGNATEKLKTGQLVTIDCSQGEQGYVYDGKADFELESFDLTKLGKPAVKIMVNIADPSRAFSVGQLPTEGVGLARLEFVINNVIKIHPMALIHPEKVVDVQVQQTIADLTASYTDKKQFFVDTLAQGVATIAAAFYPRPVIVRLSDFKSNEYRNLIGGSYFELDEENPMIGFRGASRYYDDRYKEAFALECQAMKKVRNEMGLSNVKIMLPFVRTITEARKVLDVMAEHGLQRGLDDLQVIMMCEVPSNVILIDKFSELFDGFSIGSNDLTQLTLAVDRDSGLLAHIFDERDLAVKRMLTMAIVGAKEHQRPIGICGQGPSDHPDLCDFLIKTGIDSMSLTPDSVVPFLMRSAQK